MAAFPGVGDTLGRYEIVRRIGRGGMGTVFEARQVDLGRTVALKVLSSELADDPDFRARFAREARMLATLDSPHVIQVFETGEQQGEFFIATQLVRGRDLLELLRAEGPLPAAAALRVVGQVASALADAHEAGVLHRDVKPSNILIRESRADHFAYLCDFGIARQTDSTHTRTGGVLGTLSYLAPECHEGADASPASDLYSLGCVLWAALTGRAPFERTSEYQQALAHLQAEIPVYVGSSQAASQINALLRQSMAKSPQDRFESAGAMHAALLEAEEIARGLQRGAVGDTEASSALYDHDRTQMRIAQPAQGGRGTADGGRSVGRRRATRAFAVWAVAAVAVLVLAGTAVALLRGPAADRTAAAPPPTAATSSPTTKASASRAPRPRRSASRQPTLVASSTLPAGTPADARSAPDGTTHLSYFDVTVNSHLHGEGFWAANVTVCYVRPHPGANPDGTTRVSTDPWSVLVQRSNGSSEPVRVSTLGRAGVAGLGPEYTERLLNVGECQTGWIAVNPTGVGTFAGMRYAAKDFPSDTASWQW